MFSPSRGKSNASFDSTLEKVPKAVFILVMGVGRRVGGQFLNLSYPPPGRNPYGVYDPYGATNRCCCCIKLV